MARLSGVCRDAEVRLEWIGDWREKIANAGNPGLAYVERQLRRERRTGDRNLLRELNLHFDVTSTTLRRRLLRYRVMLDPRETRDVTTTRELMSTTLLDMIGTVRERLDAPMRIGDVRALHLARIASKRLRYALEPLAEGTFASRRLARSAATAAAQLSSLQDELGKLHDAHLFRRWLRTRTREPRPQPAHLTACFRALHQLLREQAVTSYGIVSDAASRRRMCRVLVALEESATAMAAQSRPADPFRI